MSVELQDQLVQDTLRRIREQRLDGQVNPSLTDASENTPITGRESTVLILNSIRDATRATMECCRRQEDLLNALIQQNQSLIELTKNTNLMLSHLVSGQKSSQPTPTPSRSQSSSRAPATNHLSSPLEVRTTANAKYYVGTQELRTKVDVMACFLFKLAEFVTRDQCTYIATRPPSDLMIPYSYAGFRSAVKTVYLIQSSGSKGSFDLSDIDLPAISNPQSVDVISLCADNSPVSVNRLSIESLRTLASHNYTTNYMKLAHRVLSRLELCRGVTDVAIVHLLYCLGPNIVMDGTTSRLKLRYPIEPHNMVVSALDKKVLNASATVKESYCKICMSESYRKALKYIVDPLTNK
jgi:hypothetical protein